MGVSLLLLLAWDATGWDLPLARWSGGALQFPLRDNWFLNAVMHQGGRGAGWVVLLALVLGIARPFAGLRMFNRAQRVGLVLAVLASLLVVSLLKSISQTSCPWDMTEFGGTAAYVSHWAWGVLDGGGGRCFPAGHASAAFAFLAVPVWFMGPSPKTGRLLLAVVLVAGFTLGWVQQVRGAHYMSHTLWTAWLCGTSALLAHAATAHWMARAARRAV